MLAINTQNLHRAGFVDMRRMREYDALWQAPTDNLNWDLALGETRHSLAGVSRGGGSLKPVPLVDGGRR